MTFSFRPMAEDDLRRIARYIATDNPSAARNWRREILEICRMLGEFPDLGTSRDDLPSHLRIFPKGSYIIVFRSSPGGIAVIRILHGARDWPRLVR